MAGFESGHNKLLPSPFHCSSERLVIISSLLLRYNKEREARKKLQNDLIELRGNIRVFCRVRPPAHQGDSVMDFPSDQELLVRGAGSSSNGAQAAAASSSKAASSSSSADAKASAVSLFQVTLMRWLSLVGDFLCFEDRIWTCWA